jgi:serine/threonine-protein kinase
VYRGRDTELDRIVALKVPHASLLNCQDFSDRLTREARAAAQLNHPGIVRVYDAVRSEHGTYLVSEFAVGFTLAHQLRNGSPLGTRFSVILAAQLADALESAAESMRESNPDAAQAMQDAFDKKEI